MNESDCFVYEYEVEREYLGQYMVEYIDTNNASGCVKSQLSGTYLLSIPGERYVVVIPDHPEKNLHLIEKFIKEYANDSVRLTEFYREENKILLVLQKLFYNPEYQSVHLEYRDWKYVYLSRKAFIWSADSIKMETGWPWNLAN